MEWHASGGSGRSAERWELAHCWRSPQQKAPAVLWTLWLRAGRGRRAKSGKVLSQSGEKVSSRFPPFPTEVVSAEVPKEGLCWWLLIKRPLKEGPWAENAALEMMMSSQRGLSLDYNSFQELRCTSYVPSLVWGGQLFPHEACQVKLLQLHMVAHKKITHAF